MTRRWKRLGTIALVSAAVAGTASAETASRRVAPDRSFAVEITPSGFRAVGDAGDGFAIDFTLFAIDRAGVRSNPVPGDLRERPGRVERSVAPAVTEWWRDDDQGIEHGFTVDRPVANGQGMTRFAYTLRGSLLSRPAGERGIVFFAADGLSRFRYDGLLVHDADGVTLPSELRMTPGGFEIAFDDRDARYPVTVDPLMSTAAWNEVGETGDEFGGAVSTAGDVNGDGYSDLLVGEPLYDGGQTDEGRILLYYGSASGLASTPAWSFESNVAGAALGRAVSTIGDANGDGYDDFAAGAPLYTETLTEQGAAFVFFGGPAGPAATPDDTYKGKVKNDRLGTSVSFAGDVDNDGYHDLVIGVPGSDSAAAEGGEVYLYFGGPSGLPSTPNWTQTSAHAGAEFGTSVSAAGDVNGDGYGDIIVGAPGYDWPEVDEGRFFVYHGSATTPSFDVGIDSDVTNRRLGTSVSGIGDVNGDGYADVAAGSPGSTATGTGRVDVYYGSSGGVTETGSVVLGDICCAAERMGDAVSTAGDVNGDGYGDLLVGSPAFGSTALSEGRVRVYVGSADGIDPDAYWTYDSGLEDARLGAAVGPAGDVDGDGYSDVVVGAPGQNGAKGRAFVFLGSGDVPLLDPDPYSQTLPASEEAGTAVAFAGDLNGDGYTDVAVADRGYSGGESGEGRVLVHYGGAGGLDASPTDFLESDSAGAGFGWDVSSAGDVNGDGYDDLLIGAPGWTTGGGLQLGRALVFHGSASGLFVVASWQTESDQDGSRYGEAVSGLGDVNADGFADVAVGAPEYSGQAADSGRVYVFLGSSTGLSTTPAAVLETDVGNASFGSALGRSDFDGDGFDDLLVGAVGASPAGSVFLYRGTSAGIDTTPATELEGLVAGEQFGYSVSGAGDYDGDGVEDIVVGAPNFSPDDGRIHLFRGRAFGIPIADGTREMTGDRTGQRVGPAGDVNGDGYGDVVAASTGTWSFPFGRIGLWLGGPSGLDPALSWWDGGTGSDRELGTGLGRGGDVDGDGFDDLLASRGDLLGGTAILPDFRVWYGGRGPGVDRVPRLQEPYSVSDPPIATRGRSPDDDSVRLRSRARTAAGRDRVQVEYEVKPLDAPFDGNGTAFSSELKTSSPGSDGSRTNYSTRILGLTAGPHYRFRLRHLSPNPWFPRTPWMVAAGCDETPRTFLTDCLAQTWYRDDDGDGFGDPGAALERCTAPAGFVADADDCDDTDGSVWSVPGEASLDPVLHTGGPAGTTTFSWSFSDTGGTTGDPAGDLIRSDGPDAFDVTGTCFPTASSTFDDSDDPGAGAAFFYLVRGKNGCGDGTWGADSTGAERTWQTCP